MLNPWNRVGRFALVGLALIILGVGACSTSTTTEVDMGKKMTIGFSAQTDAEMISVDTGLSHFLDTQPGIENVSVSISEIDGGPKTIEESYASKLRREVFQIEVIQENGVTEIKVEIQQEVED